MTAGITFACKEAKSIKKLGEAISVCGVELDAPPSTIRATMFDRADLFFCPQTINNPLINHIGIFGYFCLKVKENIS
jgi:hypothetical protein